MVRNRSRQATFGAGNAESAERMNAVRDTRNTPILRLSTSNSVEQRRFVSGLSNFPER